MEDRLIAKGLAGKNILFICSGALGWGICTGLAIAPLPHPCLSLKFSISQYSQKKFFYSFDTFTSYN
jgi:hypothetical protein